MLFCSTVFEKLANCIDFLSFDPGLVNAGIVHVRVDAENGRFCILHSALLDVLKPLICFSRPKWIKKRKNSLPLRVQPFCSKWPLSELDFVYTETPVHTERLETLKTDDDDIEKILFADRVALLPMVLEAVSWLNANVRADKMDYVLIEVQDPQNPQMRSVAHAIQTFYETKNAISSSETQIKVQFVSSRLKLSGAVLTALAAELEFECLPKNSVGPARALFSKDQLVGLVDATSQPTRKKSAVRIFDALAELAPPEHQFFDWYSKQRPTKHNIIDALLQCLSHCLENSIGFEEGILNGTRKQIQSLNAKARRVAKKAINLENKNLPPLCGASTTVASNAIEAVSLASISSTSVSNGAVLDLTGENFSEIEISSRSSAPSAILPAAKRRKIVPIKF